MRLILLWSCLGMAAAEVAAAVVEVLPEQMTPVNVSRSGLSRISLSDGRRISNVWGRSSMVQIETDGEGGQVFIRPLPGATSFALYLRDDGGDTHSLLVSPVDSLPDNILLRLPQATEVAEPPAAPAAESHAGAMLRQLLPLPQGDGAGQDYLRELPWWQRTRLYLLRSERRQGGLLAEHYQLHNLGGDSLELYEAEFSRLGGVLAVTLGSRSLPAGGVANVHVLRRP